MQNLKNVADVIILSHLSRANSFHCKLQHSMTHLVKYWWSPQLSFSPPLSLSSSVPSHPGPPVVSCRGYDARTLHFCTYCRYRTNDERCKKMIRISLKLLLHYSCFRKIVIKFVSLRMQGCQVRTKSLVFLSWLSVTQSLSSKSVNFLPWSGSR